MTSSALLGSLNPAQRAAVEYDIEHGRGAAPGRPLLIIAGAGTGKTRTLAHRVAQLILRGADPRPHPAADILPARRRGDDPPGRAHHRRRSARDGGRAGAAWAGTFHAIGQPAAARLTPADRARSGVHGARSRRRRRPAWIWCATSCGFAEQRARFPKKATCLAIYSRVVNAQAPLEQVLDAALPVVPRMAGRAAAAVRRLRRGQAAPGTCSTTTTCCSTGRR